MPFQSINKKQKFAITGIFLLMLFLTTYKAGAQTDLGGTDPKVGCTQDFCLVVWKSGSSLVGMIPDKYGGVKVDNINFGQIPADAYVVVQPGSSKILVAFTDPSQVGSLTDFFVDSSGQKTQISLTQYYIAPTSTKIDTAYDSKSGLFFFATGAVGLNLYENSPSYGNIKFPLFLLESSATGSGVYNRVVYNKGSGLLQAVISVISTGYCYDSTTYTNSPCTKKSMGYYTYSQASGPSTAYTASGGLTGFPYSEDGDVVYNPKDSSSVLVYTNNSYIFMYKLPADNTALNSIPVIRGFTVTQVWDPIKGIYTYTLPTTQNPNPESISATPLSFDPINNKFVLVYSRGGIGYIQAMGSDLVNSGSEISLGYIVSPPVIHYNPSTGKHLVVYATSTGIQTKYIDASTASPTVFTSRVYTQSEDGETSQYTVFDNSNLIALATGSGRLADVQASFEHPTWKTRLKGTLEFSKADIDLRTLVIEATDTATAVNKIGTKGLANKILLVPNTNNGAGVRVCPYATTVAKIAENCLGELVFKGPFPETQGTVKVALSGSTALPPPTGYWKFDETAGATASDSTPNNNAGALVNNPLWTAGKIGNGLSFTGTNYVKVPNSQPLNNLNKFTTSLWFKQTAQVTQQVLVNKPGAQLYIEPTGQLDSFIGGAKNCASGFTVKLNTWYHAAVTYDGSTIKIYVDGQQKGADCTASGGGTGTADFFIGSDHQPSQFFNGVIDDVRVYNDALTNSQINELYAPSNPSQPQTIYEISGLSGSGAMLFEGGVTPPPSPSPTPTGTSPSPSASPPAQKTNAQLSLTKSFLTQDNKKTEVAASYKIKDLPDKENGKGHLHAYLDDGQYIVVDSKTFDLKGLSAGQHKLKLELVNNDHTAYTPAASKEITFTIGQAASPGPSASAAPSPSPNTPVITITSPTDRSTAVGPDITVTFDLTNFEIKSSVIKDAACKIAYSDQRQQEQPMSFKDGNYRHERTFASEPSNIEATVTCSHPSYTEESAKIILLSGGSPTSSTRASPSGGLTPTPTATTLPPIVKLTNPDDNKIVGTEATFVCTATGSDLKEISLYTNIDGGSSKKYRTETVTSSPATKQFKVQNIPEGSYEWNCEAKTAAGKTYKAPANRKFEVKEGTTGPNLDCTETKDCGPWEPNECPENGIQTRSCKNSKSCGYPLSRSCIYPGGPGATGAPAGGETGSRVSTQKEKAGDATPIIIVALVSIGAIGGVLFFLKKKQGGNAGSLFRGFGKGE